MSVATISNDSPNLHPLRLGRGLLVVALAVVIGHLGFLFLHFRALWQQEQYQYFPFVLAAVAWFLWSRCTGDGAAPSKQTTKIAGYALALSILLLLVALLFVSSWLGAVSAVIASAALFAYIGSLRKVTYLWGIWLLLWLVIPPPLGADRVLVTRLQQLSSSMSSSLLDLLKINHLMSGNVLEVPGKQFFVAEACSGIISIMSVIAAGAIFAVYKNRSLLQSVMLVVAGVLWAVVMNVARITIIAFVYVRYGWDWSHGAVHDVLGLALFGLTFTALVSTDQLLSFFLAPIRDPMGGGLTNAWDRFVMWTDPERDETAGDEATNAAVAVTQMNPMPMPRMLMVAVPFVLLGLAQIPLVVMGFRPETHTAAVELAKSTEEGFLPETIGPWKRDGFEVITRGARDLYGRYSNSYTYKHSETGKAITVSFDYPYMGGWHDLCYCYKGFGWTIHQRLVKDETSKVAQSEWKYVEADIENPEGKRAYLVFSAFDAAGAPGSPVGEWALSPAFFRLRRRMLQNIAPQLFQVQVFALSSEPPGEELKEELDQLFFECRERFYSHIVKSGG